MIYSFRILLLLLWSTMLLGQNYTLDQVKSYPFPNELTAASQRDRIAWAVDESGLRNIYVAEGPAYEARKVTNYTTDLGQELSFLSISDDGKWIVYIKGGDFGSNWDDEKPVNPAFLPEPPKVQILSIAFEGGEPNVLGEGIDPVISPNSDWVVFSKEGQLFQVPVDGSEEAKKLFHARGNNVAPVWSPDGTKIAFESRRGDHAFIGLYTGEGKALQWISPSFDSDQSPRWSPDGKAVVFIRRPGKSFAKEPILGNADNPWQIVKVALASGLPTVLWSSPDTPRGTYPYSQGGTNLHWADGAIVFLSYHDGWPHLYSIPENGGKATLLTPGNFMAEYISLSPDKKSLYFCANTGNSDQDIDRRHIVKVPVNKEAMEVLTPGEGLEWTPFVMGGSSNIAYISATAQRPPLVTVMNAKTKRTQLVGESLVPKDFPAKQLVTPRQVVFEAPDGKKIHASFFEPSGKKSKNPAIVYIHGGPMRQMLLGWHYSNYYSNAYALNQYLASQGFAVLSVNYRMGIGYGHDFHFPDQAGWKGASEYQDIKAAGEWLASLPSVDATKIGVYGGSYGGYLTAMALGRDSDLFAAGVDIHGVHERTVNRVADWRYPNQYEIAPDAEEAVEVAWRSSPVADVAGWKSPVLIIHADDDRNVYFNQSTDLVQRLRKKGDVRLETMVIVDDTHHFMLFNNQMKVNKATADFFLREFKP